MRYKDIALFETNLEFLVFILFAFLISSLIFYLDKILFFNKKRTIIIYCWHSLFCILYIFYTFYFVNDSISYFEDSKFGDRLIDHTLSMNAIVFINRIFIDYYYFSYATLFLFYNFVGTLGLLFLDKSFRTLNYNNKIHTTFFSNLIIFLPSLSFWSTSIGKDALGFFSISFICWSLISKNNVFLFFSFILLLLFRPHHGFIFIISYFFTLIIHPDTSFIIKNNFYRIRMPLIIFTLFFFIFILWQSLLIVGLGEIILDISNFNLIGIYETFKSRMYDFQHLKDFKLGSGYVEIYNFDIFGLSFNYLFRPLPMDAYSLFTLLSSLENLVLIFIFIYFFIFFSSKIYNKFYNVVFQIYFLVALLPVSLFSPNFGIIARQKWLILIPVFLVFISMINSNNLKNRKLPTNH